MKATALSDLRCFLKLYTKLKDDESQFYHKYIQLTDNEYFDIYLRTRNQSENFEWKALSPHISIVFHELRKNMYLLISVTRITTSKAYKFFTYVRNHKKSEMGQMIEEHIFKEINPTNDMRFGSENESVCIDVFEKRYAEGPIWRNCGLLINKFYPWFGFSADGFVFEDNQWTLLEVKCPKIARTAHGLDMIKKIPFLHVDEKNVITLREKHHSRQF